MNFKKMIVSIISFTNSSLLRVYARKGLRALENRAVAQTRFVDGECNEGGGYAGCI